MSNRFTWILCGATCGVFSIASPACAALHPGDVLVDYFNGSALGGGSIVQYSPTGTVLETFTGPGQQWLGVSLTPDGKIATYSGQPSATLKILDPATGTVASVTAPDSYPSGRGDSSVFQDGTIAVAEQSSVRVHEYTPSGALIKTITLPSGSYVFGTTVAPDNTLWVTDITAKSITHITENGNFLGSFPVSFAPVDMVINPADSTLWVMDQTASMIHHLSAAGTPIGSFATPNGDPTNGFAIGNDGTFYLTTAFSNTIYHVSSTGSLLGSFAGSTEPGMLMVVPTPEPATACLLLSGGAILMVRRRR